MYMYGADFSVFVLLVFDQNSKVIRNKIFTMKARLLFFQVPRQSLAVTWLNARSNHSPRSAAAFGSSSVEKR